jgi:hypothetical protein
VVGVAVSVTLGGGVTVGGTTATLTVCVADPPAPVQVRANEALLVKGPLEAVPLVALPPLQFPLAAQDDALVDDHVRVVAEPEFTVDGDADSVTDGPWGIDGDCVTFAVTVCPAVPPTPLHVSV